MSDKIQGYIIGSVHEKDRIGNINLLKTQLPYLVYQEAVYPKHVKVPFVNRIKEMSYARTGYKLNDGEIGCLLSHREAWKKIADEQRGDKMFLVLESDSNIHDIKVVARFYESMSENFDIFFWGAWEGHMKLLRSTKRRLSDGFIVGEPFIKTVYCTYGYSLNKKAAIHLLEKTNKVGYPVDQFKKFIHKDELRVGGVMPELITTIGRGKSYIQENRNSVKEFFNWLLLDCKNSLICLFR